MSFFYANLMKHFLCQNLRKTRIYHSSVEEISVGQMKASGLIGQNGMPVHRAATENVILQGELFILSYFGYEIPGSV